MDRLMGNPHNCVLEVLSSAIANADPLLDYGVLRKTMAHAAPLIYDMMMRAAVEGNSKRHLLPEMAVDEALRLTEVEL